MTDEAAPEPRRKRGRGIPRDELELRYPSMATLAVPGEATRRAWVARFNERPDAMHSLLADFIKQVHAKPGRIGQRPMPHEHEVDFHTLVFGEENESRLVQVLPSLTKGLPDRDVAELIHMSKSKYQRMRRGEYSPDVNEIRLIAAAFDKPPAFFVEYRIAMVTSAFVNLLEERPGMATKLYRDYLDVRMKETR